MGTSNKELKIKFHDQDPRCYWCGRETILTNISEIKGKPNPLLATIDHLISRYNPERWIKAKEGENRKVLACFECNNGRSAKETKQLHPMEVYLRGNGYSLNPRGKPVVNGTVETKEELFARLKERGIEVLRFDEIPEYQNNPLGVLDNSIKIV
jgi:hypothetical protein